MMTVLIVIYCVGVAVFFLPGLFAFGLAAGFAGDSPSYAWGLAIKGFFMGIFVTFFWPISIPLIYVLHGVSEKRTVKSNAEYQAKLEAEPNYGKLMVLENLPERLNEYEGTMVAVRQWLVYADNHYVTPVEQWPNGTKHAMYWSVQYMREI